VIITSSTFFTAKGEGTKEECVADQRVALLGTGLLGGSIGLALTDAGFEVAYGFDRDPGRTLAAVQAGACRQAAFSIAEAVCDVDVVFVATPVSAIAETVLEAAQYVRPGTLLTDVGSVKASVVQAVQERIPSHAFFVGGHPMAGSEQVGIDAATSCLFRDAVWVVTPTASSNSDAVMRLYWLVNQMGASVLSLDPQAHDESVSIVSHLAHVAAASLLSVMAERSAGTPPLFRMAASGFRDMTRIAAGSPAVWVDILYENAAAVQDALKVYIEELERFREHLDDRVVLWDLLERARETRSSLPSLLPAQDLYMVVVGVADQAGVLADVTTAVGERGINVVDMELRHSPEGGGGLLVLTVVGSSSADLGVLCLQQRGYAAHAEPSQMQCDYE